MATVAATGDSEVAALRAEEATSREQNQALQ